MSICNVWLRLLLLGLLGLPSLSFFPTSGHFLRMSTTALHLVSSPLDDDRRPIRRHAEVEELAPTSDTDWGIIHHEDNPRFPDDVESVTLSAWEAIAATIYEKQQMDPNVASNARTKSIFGYRPIRQKQDRGRIGIEIDGASYMKDPQDGYSDGEALRQISLVLAARLAKGPWEGYESSKQDFCRPVAIYYNTIKQSLFASMELATQRHSRSDATDFSNITIRTLADDTEIPTHMRRQRKVTRGLPRGQVNPEQGVVVIVQPTDYNAEFRPPGPAVHSVSNLQQLVARAAVENLPVVVISPRFLVIQSIHANNWDQNGFQKSSMFGGTEPSIGPTPWVLRDFFPPAFVWVGSIKPNQEGRVAMIQSVMHDGHAWHLFRAKDGVSSKSSKYPYLASTRTAAGRPTAAIVKFIHDEWSIE